MNSKIIVLFLLIIWCSCSEKKLSDHPGFRYYPEKSILKDGYVNKYYTHYYPANQDQSAATVLSYSKFQLVGNDQYKIDRYNAGFDLISSSSFRIAGDSVNMISGMNISGLTDTSYTNVRSSTVSTWERSVETPFEVEYENNDKTFIYSEYQVALVDSTIMEKPAKVFYNASNYREKGSDSLFNEGISQSYYVTGLGYYGGRSKYANYIEQIELIEQMSLAEFEKRADHGMHRVAWIDPENTLSDDSDFAICGHERNIADYYNSTPDGRYLHSKHALKDTLANHLDSSKLFDQSGRLVFRFVVNCEGKAGRFIAKGYDLAYQPMEFEKETVDHLFNILSRLKDWRKVVIRDEERDAYFYITFNIEQGEIVNILP